MQIRLIQPGVVQYRPFKHATPQVGLSEVGLSKVRAGQVCGLQVKSPRVRAGQIRARKVDLAKTADPTGHKLLELLPLRVLRPF